MDWLIGILVVGGMFAFVRYLNQSQKKRLLSEDKIVDRGNNNYYKQMHIFTTTVSSVEELGNALNQAPLSENKISFEPNYSNGVIIFHQRGSGGTFGAALRTLENDGEKFCYKFQVEAWREGNSGLTRRDFFGANILLTAIERAFFQLDSDTNVQRLDSTHKTKPSFF